MEDWSTLEIIRFSPEGVELEIKDVSLPPVDDWTEIRVLH